jgi:hypothetical protein
MSVTAVQDQSQVEELEGRLSAQLAKPSLDAVAALAMIQDMQKQQLELTIMHEDHLATAAGFPIKQVAQALAVRPLHGVHSYGVLCSMGMLLHAETMTYVPPPSSS